MYVGGMTKPTKFTPVRKLEKFHGFWLDPELSRQFRKKAEADGGMAGVLRRLVKKYVGAKEKKDD